MDGGHEGIDSDGRHPSSPTPNIPRVPYHSKYFDYVSFCNCADPNQVSYFNPKTREFYYHQVPEQNLVGFAGEGFIFFPRKPSPTPESNPAAGGHNHQGVFPGPRYNGAKHFGPSSMESGIAEVSFVVLAFILWLYSFYRLYSVWQNTLNFSEASIQGPQGWDFLVNWILERVQVKRIKTIGKGRKCEPYELEEGFSIELDNIQTSIHPSTSIDMEGNISSHFINESMDETTSDYQPVLHPFQSHEEPLAAINMKDKSFITQSIV